MYKPDEFNFTCDPDGMHFICRNMTKCQWNLVQSVCHSQTILWECWLSASLSFLMLPLGCHTHWKGFSWDTEWVQWAVIKFCLFQTPVHPTTGILAVFVALNYCDVVHIAGFGYPNSKSQRQPIHYYGYDTMRSMKVGCGHLPSLVIHMQFFKYSSLSLALCCRILTMTSIMKLKP